MKKAIMGGLGAVAEVVLGIGMVVVMCALVVFGIAAVGWILRWLLLSH